MVQTSQHEDALLTAFTKRLTDLQCDRGTDEDTERDFSGQNAAAAALDFLPESEDNEGRHHPNMDNRRSEVEKSQTSHVTRLLDVAMHWSWITIFSVLGTLSRLGLQSLNDYSGHLMPPLVWAQFLGCVVMGFVTQDERVFPKKTAKNDALYLGITVGYCGSTTSFSAWILQIYQDLANTDGFGRSRGYNIISIITQVTVTLAVSLAAFRLGNHFAIFSNEIIKCRAIPRIKSTPLIIALTFVAIGFQVGSIITAGLRREWRGTVAFAMVFSPAGALSRWYLSRFLNGINPAFPLGTFTANMIGSLLESIFYLLQHHVEGGNACSSLQGLQDGYCGALTTVSTFVVELCTLNKRHAYVYAITSVVGGSIIYILVDGVDYWTHGSSSGYEKRCEF